MFKYIKRLLGIDVLQFRLDGTLEELAQDDVKLADKVRKMRKDLDDLILFLNVERKESYIEDKSRMPYQPKLEKSVWVKKKK